MRHGSAARSGSARLEWQWPWRWRQRRRCGGEDGGAEVDKDESRACRPWQREGERGERGRERAPSCASEKASERASERAECASSAGERRTGSSCDQGRAPDADDGEHAKVHDEVNTTAGLSFESRSTPRGQWRAVALRPPRSHLTASSCRLALAAGRPHHPRLKLVSPSPPRAGQ